VLSLFKSTVLLGIKFNDEYMGYLSEDTGKRNLIKSFIEMMGGQIVNRHSATHFLVVLYKRDKYLQEVRSRRRDQIFSLNIKFVFHSYFFIQKVDENDREYTELF
jgi:hypothetical protein